MIKKVFILVLSITLFSCGNQFSEKEQLEYTKKGKEIAQASFKELSTNLKTQMKAGGPAKAIPFCKEEALPILAELSEKHNATIKRSSDQLRSCKIEPALRELDIIHAYKQSKSQQKELKPIVEIDNE